MIALARIALVVGCAVAAGCGSAPRAADSKPAPVLELPTLPAEVYTVAQATWPTVVRTHGSLAANEIAVVGTKVAGRITAVHVDLGDTVKAGDPLATLDQEECRLQVAQAEAQLAEAAAAVGLRAGDSPESLDRQNAPPVRQEKALWDEAAENLKRARNLQVQNAISESEILRLDAAERVAAARYASSLNAVEEKIALIRVRSAEVALAQERLRDSVIRSPFDGRVQQRQTAPGEYVSIGHPIATVVHNHPLRFRGTVPERHAQQLAVGQSVTLQIESVSEPRVVKITRISPVLDDQSRALLFEALVGNSDGRLQTGLFAEGEIILDPQAKSLVVPRSAVAQFAGAEKVWKVVDGMAGEQLIRTGAHRGDGIEIIAGLAAGDLILRDASQGKVAKIEPLVAASQASATSGSEGAPTFSE